MRGEAAIGRAEGAQGEESVQALCPRHPLENGIRQHRRAIHQQHPPRSNSWSADIKRLIKTSRVDTTNKIAVRAWRRRQLLPLIQSERWSDCAADDGPLPLTRRRRWAAAGGVGSTRENKTRAPAPTRTHANNTQ